MTSSVEPRAIVRFEAVSLPPFFTATERKAFLDCGFTVRFAEMIASLEQGTQVVTVLDVDITVLVMVEVAVVVEVIVPVAEDVMVSVDEDIAVAVAVMVAVEMAVVVTAEAEVAVVVAVMVAVSVVVVTDETEVAVIVAVERAVDVATAVEVTVDVPVKTWVVLWAAPDGKYVRTPNPRARANTTAIIPPKAICLLYSDMVLPPFRH